VSGRRAHVRSRARAWALQVLYARDISGSETPLREYAARCLARRRVSERYRPHLERLLGLLEEHLPEVDRRIRDVMPNWRLDRLAVIDRNVLRIGAAELLFVEDVPGKVAIHEAIQLAEKYGGEESPRFVNGVLDAIYQETLVAN